MQFWSENTKTESLPFFACGRDGACSHIVLLPGICGREIIFGTDVIPFLGNNCYMLDT